MTTETDASQEEERLPRYFADFLNEFGRFREENERQHGALRAEIGAVRIETAEQIGALRAEMIDRISNVETRIAQMEARLMWRGLGGLAIIASLMVAALRLLPA